MVTTIQVDERTILLLKKIKEELQVSSYDEAIKKMAVQRMENKSMAGSLKKHLKKGETAQDIINELQQERRKSGRF